MNYGRLLTLCALGIFIFYLTASLQYSSHELLYLKQPSPNVMPSRIPNILWLLGWWKMFKWIDLATAQMTRHTATKFYTSQNHPHSFFLLSETQISFLFCPKSIFFIAQITQEQLFKYSTKSLASIFRSDQFSSPMAGGWDDIYLSLHFYYLNDTCH